MKNFRSLFLSFALAVLTTTASAQSTEPGQTSQLPPATLCDTAGHHQFDFWIGSWNVYRSGSHKLVARSLVERVYNGCAVRENWMPLHDMGGGSLNSYRPDQNRWLQFWTDSGNSVHQYIGRLENGSMIMTGTSTDHSGKMQQLRMTFTPKPDGTVLQKGETSTDQGETWKPEYEFVYRTVHSSSLRNETSRDEQN